MKALELHRKGYTISTEKARLDIPLIHEYLSQHSYWARERPMKVVQRSIQHSLCFGVYKEDE
jgi:hypothetical protein